MHNGLTGISECSQRQQLKCFSLHGFKPLKNLSRSRQLRRGFTILELLVTFGVIGTLMGLILPAVGSAREVARQLQCKNQLKQIGLALHSYHDTNNCLPSGWQWEASRQSAYSWAVTLLPYLEQRAIYDQVNRNQILSHPLNQSARSTSIVNFLCPSDIIDPTFMLYEENKLTETLTPLFELPTANYFGVFGTIEPDDSIPAPLGDGTFLEFRLVRFADLQRGLSNTIIVGERTMAKVPSTWLGVDSSGEDAACRLVGMAMTTPNCNICDECEFSSRHPGGANFLWGDGRVRIVSENIDSSTYQGMARRLTEF
ncbi:DUF1559 domain-containing protein [Gimesia fumaroli]|uniref:DUF1559 domain-containing protein n=1 Tax=Gimesia fumaroli TaxID=2527976 RepID=A0A518I5L3_9PLAN|nr:DUF1559 domain-containing protein [Gimesia fumaroli]QDV48394.1 hypothetical protein Enr17x_04060 [Gimesia fumaroli]